MWDLSFTTQPGMLSNKNQYLFLEKRKNMMDNFVKQVANKP